MGEVPQAEKWEGWPENNLRHLASWLASEIYPIRNSKMLFNLRLPSWLLPKLRQESTMSIRGPAVIRQGRTLISLCQQRNQLNQTCLALWVNLRYQILKKITHLRILAIRRIVFLPRRLLWRCGTSLPCKMLTKPSSMRNQSKHASMPRWRTCSSSLTIKDRSRTSKSAFYLVRDSPMANSCSKILSKRVVSKKTWSSIDASIRLRSPETTSAGQSRCVKPSLKLLEMNGKPTAWKTSNSTPTSRNRGSRLFRKNVRGKSKCRTN